MQTARLYTVPETPPPIYVSGFGEQAGFDEVYLSQVGGRLDGAFDFFASKVLPRLRDG